MWRYECGCWFNAASPAISWGGWGRRGYSSRGEDRVMRASRLRASRLKGQHRLACRRHMKKDSAPVSSCQGGAAGGRGGGKLNKASHCDRQSGFCRKRVRLKGGAEWAGVRPPTAKQQGQGKRRRARALWRRGFTQLVCWFEERQDTAPANSCVGSSRAGGWYGDLSLAAGTRGWSACTG